MKKVVAYLQGGLGNQLFIYAAARALSLRTGASLSLDGSYFLDDKVFNRRFALGPFKCSDVSGYCIDGCRPLPVSCLVTRFSRRFRYALLRGFTSRVGNYCCDRRPYKHRRLPECWSGTLTIDGYWQSERYFYEQRKQLVQDLQLKDDAWLCADPLAKEIVSTAQSIFLHVRSYREVPGNENGECALRMKGYYANAINYVSRHIPDGRLFVFSDDIEWAKTRLLPAVIKDCRLPVIFNDGNSSQLRDFSLMRLCKHGIIADSSFSWWAGWLGEQQWLERGESPIRIRVGRRVLNDDFWPERWLSIEEV